MYSKVFVQGPRSREELAQVLQAGLGASLERRTLTLTDGAELDVRLNDDADPEKTAGEDGFLYFPYYLDVQDERSDDEPDADAPLLATVRQILAVLSAAGFIHVVAAAFEDLLPGHGDNRPR